LKVKDENSRIRIQDPDPLVRVMDPRIRIRIHPKMSWIRNFASKRYLTNSLFSLQLGRGGGEQDSGRASHAELTVTDKHCRFQLTEVQAQMLTPLEICVLVFARIYAVGEKKILLIQPLRFQDKLFSRGKRYRYRYQHIFMKIWPLLERYS
jgi:hypothetical protein